MSSERLDDRALAGELATAAGQLLLQVRSDSGLSGKELGDAGDLRANDLLLSRLAADRPGLPVVLCSGYTGGDQGRARAGDWPFISKPFSLETLAQALAPSIAGDWYGTLDAGPQKLPLVFHIQPDGSATLDSPAQMARGLPATATLKDGIETRLRDAIPEVLEVVSI